MSEHETPKGIPSPFSDFTVVKGAKSSGDIAETMVDGFAAVLATYDEVGVEANQMTLTAFLGGFTSSLKALGFTHDDAMRLTRQVAERIVAVGTSDEPCNCPNCKHKNK